MQPSRHLLHLKGQTTYFRQTQIKLYKNKTYSKFIKSHQCSLERSHDVLIMLIKNNYKF